MGWATQETKNTLAPAVLGAVFPHFSFGPRQVLRAKNAKSVFLASAIRIHALEVGFARPRVHLEERAVVAMDSALDRAADFHPPDQVRSVLARLDVERAVVAVDLLDDRERLIVKVFVLLLNHV